MRRAGWVALGILLLPCSLPQQASSQSSHSSTLTPVSPLRRDSIGDYGRAIANLQRGINENWTCEQYLQAFDPPNHPKRAGEDLGLRAAIRQSIEWRMSEREIWDEKPPISVQAAQLMQEFASQRDLLIQAQIAAARSQRDPVKLAP